MPSNWVSGSLLSARAMRHLRGERMKDYVFSLCMFGILCALVQSLLPQGVMKKSAIFACSILLITLFLEGGMALVQEIKLPDFRQEAVQMQTYAPNEISARQMVQSVLGSEADCRLQYDMSSNVEQIIIICPQQFIMPNTMQSITDALCGIYDIEEEQIILLQGR